MNILVTGGTGFIGSHLVDRLIANGNNVRCLVRRSSNTSYMKKLGAEIVVGDLEDKESLKKAVNRIDVVYHLAAKMDTHNAPYHLYTKTNVLGTKNLIESCLNSSLHRFVAFSSIRAVTGSVNIRRIIDETYQCNPSSPYGISKLESEKIVLQAYRKYGLPVAILRPTMVYGPRECSNQYAFFKAIHERKLRIIGNGENLLSLGYVENIVDAAVLIQSEEKAVGETFFVADNKNYTLNEVVHAIAKACKVQIPKLHIPIWAGYLSGATLEFLGKLGNFEVPLNRKRIKTLTGNCYFSIEKAKKLLGYIPKIDLEDGVRRTLEWYFENGYLVKRNL